MMYDFKNRTISKDAAHLYGAAIPESDKKAGYISYATLSKSFNAVLCNNAPEINPELCDNIENGELFNEAGEPIEIYQYYIIDNNAADILKLWTDEIVFYIDALGVYVWGVTHYGTAWSCVPTNIRIM